MARNSATHWPRLLITVGNGRLRSTPGNGTGADRLVAARGEIPENCACSLARSRWVAKTLHYADAAVFSLLQPSCLILKTSGRVRAEMP
jgi:hypothetical protein